MNVSKDKSANQLYKQQCQAGMTHLGFKDWLQQQKARNFSNVTGAGDIPANGTLDSSIQDAITQMHQEGGLQTTAGTNYTFGISNTALIWTGVGVGLLIAGIITYKIIHRK